MHLNGSRGFIPISLRTELRGQTYRTLSLEYSQHERLGWVPRTWEDHSLFDEDGKPSTTLRCEVLQFEINVPLEERIFTIEFPEGAHAARFAGPGREGDEEYFIAGADGELSGIPRSQYRRVEKIEPPAAASASP